MDEGHDSPLSNPPLAPSQTSNDINVADILPGRALKSNVICTYIMMKDMSGPSQRWAIVVVRSHLD